MSRDKEWERYKREPDEGLVRVVATGFESLLQSRPKMTRAWLLNGRLGKSAHTGFVSIDFIYDRLEAKNAAYSWYASVRLMKTREHRLRLIRTFDPPRWEKYTWEDGRWMIEPLSQSEAERMAASSFTGGRPVQTVSDAAIAKARDVIAFAEKNR